MTTTTHETKITADPELPLVRITREFDAPREKVFPAHTDLSSSYDGSALVATRPSKLRGISRRPWAGPCHDRGQAAIGNGMSSTFTAGRRKLPNSRNQLPTVPSVPVLARRLPRRVRGNRSK